MSGLQAAQQLQGREIPIEISIEDGAKGVETRHFNSGSVLYEEWMKRICFVF